MRAFVAALFAIASSVVWADSVTLKDQVQTAVARDIPKASGAKIGTLSKGESAEVLGSVPHWYRVRLSTGAVGFLSKTSVQLSSAPGTTPPVATAAPLFTVDAVDVGTGLAVVVRGSDFLFLYDGGSNDDAGIGNDNRLIAYFRKAWPGITRIDHVVLSHPHKDHVELLGDVISQFEVGHLWDSGRFNDICGYRALLDAASKENGLIYHNALASGARTVRFKKRTCAGRPQLNEVIELRSSELIQTGVPVQLGQGAVMTVLYADGGDGADVNDNSLVLRMDLGGTRLLFTGDAGGGGRAPVTASPKPSSVEGTLLTCCGDEIKADVLIVGHHGSKTSSRRAFLSKVAAKTFIISSGPKKYSSVTLPDDEVVQELESRGTLFRTDMGDDECVDSEVKLGNDNDGKPGGCSHVRLSISATGLVGQYVDLGD